MRRKAHMGSPMARSAWANRPHPDRGARSPHRSGPGRPVHSPRDEPKVFQRGTAVAFAQSSHDAEVNHDEMAIAIYEKIPLMHVRMKEAITDGVAQEALDELSPRALRSSPRPQGCVSRWCALNPFRRQHLRPVNGQLTAGKRKFGSSAGLGHFEMADASMRRSSSSFIE